MSSLSEKREIWLDENIDEQEFVEIISELYNQECFIYSIIPDWEEELLSELSNQFIKVKDVTLPRTFPSTIGYLGYVRDTKKSFVYEFYLRSTTMDCVFSTVDVTKFFSKINKKNIDLYELFQSNEIPHITIGHDGQWLNIVEY